MPDPLRSLDVVDRAPESADILGVIAHAASTMLNGQPTALLRFNPDGASVVVAAAVTDGQAPIGTTTPPVGDTITARVHRSGRAARIDDYTGVNGAGRASEFRLRAAVGVPIAVHGRLWGVLIARSSDAPLAPDTERRLGHFAEIIAAAITGAQAQDNLRAATEEQAALLRVAELVARGSGQDSVFDAVALEASALIGHEPTTLLRFTGARSYTVVASCGGPAPAGTHINVATDDKGLVAEIMRTRGPVRLDDLTHRGPAYARDDYGVYSSVGVPIIVDDALWGVLAGTTSGRRLPDVAERRLHQFADLTAAAVANTQARADLRGLADEQAALLRVAELVARAAPPEAIFAAVTAEASGLVRGTAMTLTRFDGPLSLIVVAAHGGPAPIGARIDFVPDTLPDRIQRGGHVTRVDDYTQEADAQLAVEFGLVAAVSAPITVAGDVWGMLTATSGSHPLPPGTEDPLMQFAKLVAAALANVQARIEVQELADEQTALRRVAELAAREAPANDVLQEVASQAARLAGVDFSTLLRYEVDGSTEIVALDGAPEGIAIGMRAPGRGDGAVQRVWRTGRPARMDNLTQASGHWPQVAHGFGFSSSAAAPIRIHGALWGALVAVGRRDPLPKTIEGHLTNFAELTGTAISAAHARRELHVLAKEQAALRRVAELVARGAALDQIFNAVVTEASGLLEDRAVMLLRYDPDDVAVAVAVCHSLAPLGLRMLSHPDDPYPVTVEGRVWGTLIVSGPDDPSPAAKRDWLTQLTQLVATALLNAANKARLTESRARVIATADETRRRLQRDVHDSAQQRLVHTIIALKLARDQIAAGGAVADLVNEALVNAERANAELRDVVRGILPAALTRGGLYVGLESLVADLTVPVTVRVGAPRLAADLETTAYFVVAEALANVVKHARASHAAVSVDVTDSSLLIDVRDDGVGGAEPARGTGLTGLLDRVEANDGTLEITSPIGSGTAVLATLPLARHRLAAEPA
jgi:signal transduction histidine kinase/putative methionine-R-sulfoxide reductase with GAF domain